MFDCLQADSIGALKEGRPFQPFDMSEAFGGLEDIRCDERPSTFHLDIAEGVVTIAPMTKERA